MLGGMLSSGFACFQSSVPLLAFAAVSHLHARVARPVNLQQPHVVVFGLVLRLSRHLCRSEDAPQLVVGDLAIFEVRVNPGLHSGLAFLKREVCFGSQHALELAPEKLPVLCDLGTNLLEFF